MDQSPDVLLSQRCTHGLFTLDDALGAGFSPSGVQDRVRRGLWREMTRGVYASMTTPLGVPEWERSVISAYPDRAVRSHHSAARSWNIPAGEDERAWLTVGASSRWVLPSTVRFVRTRHLPSAWVRDGLPVTPPARSVVDLAMCVDRPVLRAAIADVLTRRLCLLDHVQTETDRLTRRKGHAVLREVVAEFRPEFESVLEERLGDGFRLRGVRGFEPQYAVRDARGCLVGRYDFADPRARLGVETDGWAYHGSREQQAQDKRRDRRMAALGWVTLRFVTEDVLHRLDAVIDEILAVRGARTPAA